MPDSNFIFAYFFARRHAKPWKPGERKRPKMPSTTWRVATVLCIAAGAALTWLLFRDSRSVGWRMVGGGVVGFVVGMYIVETVWERRLGRATGESPGPIGKRR